MALTDIPAAGGAGDEHRFPCHTCGADLRYKPGSDDLICDHCGAIEPIPGNGSGDRAARELDYNAALDNRLAPSTMEETRVTRCPNCGALVEFHGASHATECAYCATPVVIGTGAHRQIKPRGLLAFRLSEPEAREAMTKWLGKLWFAPNGLREYARKGRTMDGIYVPYWTFDAQTESDYSGQRGDAYYTTRTVVRNGKTKTVRERHIRWSPRRGHVARFFNDVLVLASRALPKRYTEALDPWDLDELRDYRPEYLAGFSAEGYTVELTEGMAEARAYMDGVIRQDVRRDIGGDEQRIHSVNTVLSDVTFKHILLPVWMAAYKYNGKSFRFVVNARTGKVRGERPWSAWKIAFAVVLGLIVAGIAAYVYTQNQ
ncbi:primosomal protein N' (replication factor Y) - superfamily II helicase [Frigidibacter sp. ROC022]|uniref:primosomal protein N' (replication factor Y) - superfamily II helicase n=1 Tax=Frigidibacter sp. ROC022 TaxID=2971796 RepID=UPI00215AEDDF|nr:primosomal protein N' (replication factor Y) - superfamily II helicase [Frigidibacter sp. ROC022]MCR8722877.1 primosomal protein N' (replication factor Y) - superfamily II helicase [Frigidibacter sp. ROC022]